jgi:hypothetical protein
MDTTTHYEGFVIEAYKGETGLWKLRFRKIDASPIIREYGEPSLSLEPPDVGHPCGSTSRGSLRGYCPSDISNFTRNSWRSASVRLSPPGVAGDVRPADFCGLGEWAGPCGRVHCAS